LGRITAINRRPALDAFADAAKAPDVAALGSELPARLTDLVADRVARCVRLCRDT
jgi:hypothetical protein